MHPELGQAIETNTNCQGPTIGVVEIDGTGTACPVGIEFDSILTEANPVAAPGIDLGLVRPALWSVEFNRIGLKVHTWGLLEVQFHFASF